MLFSVVHKKVLMVFGGANVVFYFMQVCQSSFEIVGKDGFGRVPQ
jgi:hypothetical protein